MEKGGEKERKTEGVRNEGREGWERNGKSLMVKRQHGNEKITKSREKKVN